MGGIPVGQITLRGLQREVRFWKASPGMRLGRWGSPGVLRWFLLSSPQPVHLLDTIRLLTSTVFSRC